MTQRDPVLINHDIPATMTMAGLAYLGEMARTVPENGIIVEVGPLFGSSTWVLAKNAHPSVTVYSIDTWEPAPWIDRVEGENPGTEPFSIDTFKGYVKDCANVVPIQGWSPGIVSKWDKTIDMFFDDASHGNPGFINNLNFFVPKIRPGGIVCGDDYASGWPDIVREVDNLAENWGVKPEIIGRVWSMINPIEDQRNTVYSTLQAEEAANIQICIKTAKGKIYDMPPSVWSGPLHKMDHIASMKIDWNKREPFLSFRWKVKFDGGEKSESKWHSPGEELAQEDGKSIIGFQFELIGKGRRKNKIEYQIGSCPKPGAKGKLVNSAAERGQKMLTTAEERHVVNAIRLELDRP